MTNIWEYVTGVNVVIFIALVASVFMVLGQFIILHRRSRSTRKESVSSPPHIAYTPPADLVKVRHESSREKVVKAHHATPLRMVATHNKHESITETAIFIVFILVGLCVGILLAYYARRQGIEVPFFQ